MTKRFLVALQIWFFVGLPVLEETLRLTLGPLGILLFVFLVLMWCWQIFAFVHYRFCRQEEFVNLLETASATQSPFETLLGVYLEDRPHNPWHHFWVVLSTLFVFPGYYFVHRLMNYDVRLARLLTLMENGVPIQQAVEHVPEVVSRQTALAIAVNQYSGAKTKYLANLPERHSSASWFDMMVRFVYPAGLFVIILSVVTFLYVFIIPMYQRIYGGFRLQMPLVTQYLIAVARWIRDWEYGLPIFLSVLFVLNMLVFSSHVKWYFPIVGRLYRLHVRGQFLQSLGFILQSGRPIPEVLERINNANLLPGAIRMRVSRLEADLHEGEPVVPGLANRGLINASMRALLVAAEKANNLPWALEELGDSLMRRSRRLGFRMAMVLFPVAILVCASMVAFVALGMFLPLIGILEGLHVR